MAIIRRFKARWNEFYFAEETPYGLALVRITLPLVLLIGVIWRWPYVRELYSTDGAPTPLWINYGSGPLVPDLAAPVAVALFTILATCLVTASVGWMTRTSLVTSCVLYTGFGLLDSVGTLTKYTVIGAHLLLLLAMSDCGAVWSADMWLHRRAAGGGRAPIGPRKSPVWPRRLIQLFIGLVYLGAAFTKMHTPAYFSGDQLTFWMLADTNFDNRLGEFLTLYPPLLTVMAYVTIVWEVAFVFLVWSSFWRIPALVLGVVFHILTYFTLGLIEFPLIYLAAYFAFVEPTEAERGAVLLRRLLRLAGVPKRRLHPAASASAPPVRPAYSPAVWGLLMAASAVAGVEVEHHLDVYGQRAAGDFLPLKPLDQAVAAEMLGPSRRVRPQDLYFAFDVGTKTMGGLLSDRRETFRCGEQAIVQCSLTPPHPDMWVEVNLHDGEDRVIRRIGQVVPRENLRADFHFAFDESYLPGPYDFVLHYDGVELTRRRVTLKGPAPQLAAR